MEKLQLWLEESLKNTQENIIDSSDKHVPQIQRINNHQ
jgi:hypothetical protein